jgi:TolB-like protein
MSFFDELKRRNVVRVGIAYAVVGWLLAQIAALALDAFNAPDWVLQAILVVLALGFPLALFFAWAYELTPQGIRRDADVERSQTSTASIDRKLDRLIIGVLAAAVLFLFVNEFRSGTIEPDQQDNVSAERQSIAVLPFVNMSDDNDNFTDGLSEELLNLLAKNPDLNVAGRTSSFAFKGHTGNFDEIGDALNVEHVLEGSVRRSGDTFRVTAQLIAVENGFHLWSETYDRPMADIFAIQDDVASAISSELRLRLVPESKRVTDNVEAYALYLESLAVVSYDASAEAIELLKQAVALDPQFAKGYEQLALAYWLAAGAILESSVARDLVQESAAQALEIDPTLVVAKVVAASMVERDGQWLDYLRGLEAAIEAEPKNVFVLGMLYGNLLSAGYFQESLVIADRMAVLDPVSAIPHFSRGQTLSALGLREEAREAFSRAADLGISDSFGAIAMDFFVAGDYESAIDFEEKHREALGEDPSLVRGEIGRILDPDTGKDYLDSYIEDRVRLITNPAAAAYEYQWYQAFGYMEEFWAKIEELQAASESSWSSGDDLIILGLVWPQSGFRRDKRFVTQKKIDLWEERGAPDTCSKIDDEWACE